MNILSLIDHSLQDYPFGTIIILIGIPLLTYLIFTSFEMRKNPMNHQIDMILKHENNEKMMDKAMEGVDNYFEKKGNNIQLMLERSNLMMKKEEYITLMMTGILVGFLVGVWFFPFGVLFEKIFSFLDAPLIAVIVAKLLDGAICAYIGMYTPKAFMLYKITQRERLLNEQIEDALLILADTIRSGININNAIKIVGKELQYPLGTEFATTYEEMVAGKTFIKALEDMKIKINNQDFTMAVNAIEIQSESGASLEPLLREMVKIIADRKILKKEIEKIVSESKMTGIFLMIAPVAMAMFMFKQNKEGMDATLNSGIGILVLGIAGILYIIGCIWIYFIMRQTNKLIK